jgi:hypothetical protein
MLGGRGQPVATAKPYSCDYGCAQVHKYDTALKQNRTPGERIVIDVKSVAGKFRDQLATLSKCHIEARLPRA